MIIPRTLQLLLLATGLILLAFSGFYAYELKEHEQEAVSGEWDFRDETNLELYTLPNGEYEDDEDQKPAALEEIEPQDLQVGKGQPLSIIPLETVPEPETAALVGGDGEGGAYYLPLVLAGAGGLFLFVGLFSLKYKKISLSAGR
ncbi:hypothetical protein [Nafulsella turpanensis]|uniref:hypothetical protein n=1 Tax=Nafulsella turpanensis TaxID=1265690 RepID=UPI00034A7898|nr:hypothetical protein [Nafulsella turpanensis]